MSSEGNGVTLTGFRKAVLASDITAAPGCVEKLFRELDPNGDGAIQFSEFMRGVLGEDKSLAGQMHIDDMRHDNLLVTKMEKTKMRSMAQERTSELLQVCPQHTFAIAITRPYTAAPHHRPSRLTRWSD